MKRRGCWSVNLHRPFVARHRGCLHRADEADALEQLCWCWGHLRRDTRQFRYVTARCRSQRKPRAVRRKATVRSVARYDPWRRFNRRRFTGNLDSTASLDCLNSPSRAGTSARLRRVSVCERRRGWRGVFRLLSQHKESPAHPDGADCNQVQAKLPRFPIRSHSNATKGPAWWLQSACLQSSANKRHRHFREAVRS